MGASTTGEVVQWDLSDDGDQFALRSRPLGPIDGMSTASASVQIVIQGDATTVTPSNGDLVITGTSDSDLVIVSPAVPGFVRVRTQFGSGTFPVTNLIVVNTATPRT